MTIGERTQYLLQARGLNAKELAERARLNASTINKCIAENRDSRPSTIRALAKGFAISYEEFIQGTDLEAKLTHGTSVRLLSQEDADRETGTYQKRLAGAKREIWFSGYDCSYNVLSQTAAFHDELRRGLKFRIMLVDPSFPLGAAASAPRINPEYVDETNFRKKLKSSIAALRASNTQFPGRIALRLLPILPAVGFFMVDPPDGLIKFEIYLLYTEHQSRPHVVISPTALEWRKFFQLQWEAHWILARPVNGFAQVASA